MAESQKSTRSRILMAAETEFLKKGYRSASLRSIAAGAGVTTGAFYGYFDSKAHVLDALVQEPYETLLQMYRSVLTDFSTLPPSQQQSDMSVYTK